MFSLDQTPAKFSLGDGQPYNLGGKPAERALLPADAQRPFPLLVFAWEINGNYFSLSGFLSGNLDEPTLKKIAESVRLP